ncbi:MBL fold metallo-hydrolase [uncultured Campylobacter sp.]|uniref:MBL fold metallo-hydrolase n=1 Tax=uncultured Campylobacter sp. TaxID=218934 RepID=UPI00260975E0|nr:MBL fold metallo-hydrolase [uncultured Campylobacter sp.]
MKTLSYIISTLFIALTLMEAKESVSTVNSIGNLIDSFIEKQDLKKQNVYDISSELNKIGYFEDVKIYLISLANLTPPYDKLIAENKEQERLIKKYENDIKTKKEKSNKHFVLLIKDKKFTALIDTGFLHTQDSLIKALKQTNTNASDIDYLILSHGHKDHLGGILKDNKNIFSKAKLIIDEKEYTWLKESKDDLVRKSVEAFAEPIFLKDENEFLQGNSVKISSKKAYGHTPGHRIFLINEQKKQDLNIFFIADLIHTSLQVKNPDISIQYDYDKDLARKTRKKFAKEFESVYNNIIIGSHSPSIIHFNK